MMREAQTLSIPLSAAQIGLSVSMATACIGRIVLYKLHAVKRVGVHGCLSLLWQEVCGRRACGCGTRGLIPSDGGSPPVALWGAVWIPLGVLQIAQERAGNEEATGKCQRTGGMRC